MKTKTLRTISCLMVTIIFFQIFAYSIDLSNIKIGQSIKYSNSQIIVKYKKGKKQSAEKAIKNKLGSKIFSSKKDLKSDNLSVIDVQDKALVKDKINELEKLSDVEYAEPNLIAKTFEADTPDYQQLQNNSITNAIQKAYALPTDTSVKNYFNDKKGISESNNLKIGVIDTGITGNKNSLSRDFVGTAVGSSAYTYNGTDSHGRIISDIILNSSNPINSIKTEIISLRAFNNGSGALADVMEAINYAKENNIGIINCSFGFNMYSQALKDVMDNSGLLFICAVANQNTQFDNIVSDSNEATSTSIKTYPASYGLKNVISVGRIGSDGKASNYNNPADTVDVYACPTEDGTSYAAAYVTAAVATGFRYFPLVTDNIIIEAIKKSSQYYNLYDNKLNILDPEKMIDYLSSYKIVSENIFVEKVVEMYGDIPSAKVTSILKKTSYTDEDKSIINEFYQIDNNNPVWYSQISLDKALYSYFLSRIYQKDYTYMENIVVSNLLPDDNMTIQYIEDDLDFKVQTTISNELKYDHKYPINKADNWDANGFNVNKITGEVGYSFNLASLPNSEIDVDLVFDPNFAFSDSKYQDIFGLGYGWRLNIPFIESTSDSGDYLHFGDGDIYKIQNNKLVGYMLDDYSISTDPVTFDGFNGSCSATTVYTDNDNTKWYFDNTGRLLGTKNKYGKTSKIAYENGIFNCISDSCGRELSRSSVYDSSEITFAVKSSHYGTSNEVAALEISDGKLISISTPSNATKGNMSDRVTQFSYDSYTSTYVPNYLNRSVETAPISETNKQTMYVISQVKSPELARNIMQYENASKLVGVSGDRNYKRAIKSFVCSSPTSNEEYNTVTFKYEKQISGQTSQSYDNYGKFLLNDSSIQLLINQNKLNCTYTFVGITSMQTDAQIEQFAYDYLDDELYTQIKIKSDVNEYVSSKTEVVKRNFFGQEIQSKSYEFNEDGTGQYTFTLNNSSYDKYGNNLYSSSMNGSAIQVDEGGNRITKETVNNLPTDTEYTIYDYSKSKIMPIKTIKCTEKDSALNTCKTISESTLTSNNNNIATQTVNNFVYDLKNSIWLTNPQTKTEYFEYNSFGNNTKVKTTDLTGNIIASQRVSNTEFTYDEFQNIIDTVNVDVADADGNTYDISTQFQYNYKGEKTQSKNAVRVDVDNAYATTYYYKPDGTLFKTVNPDGTKNYTDYEYITNDNDGSINTKVTTYTCNVYDNVIGEKDITITDSLGNEIITQKATETSSGVFKTETLTETEYDEYGNEESSIEYPEGDATSKYETETTYDDEDNPLTEITKITKSNNQTTDIIDSDVSYKYLKSDKSVDVNIFNLEPIYFDEPCSGTITIDKVAQTIDFDLTYDSTGTRVNITYADGKCITDSTINGTFGEKIQQNSETDANTEEKNDLINNTSTSITGSNDDSTKVQTTSDGSGATVKRGLVNNNGQISYTETIKDVLGREIIKIGDIDKDDNIKSKSVLYYDGQGRVIKEKILQKGTSDYSVKEYEYDCMGRITRVKLNDGNNDNYTYYVYDEFGRKIAQYSGLTSPAVYATYNFINTNQTYYSVSRFDYDERGNLIAKFVNGKSETYTYDDQNREITKTKADGSVISTEYDDQGRIILKGSTDNGVTYNNIYSYNTKGQLTFVKNQNYYTYYYYDGLGNPIQKTTRFLSDNLYYDDFYGYSGNQLISYDMHWGNNYYQSLKYSYDSQNRIVNVYESTSGANIFYTYDELGNIIKKEYKRSDISIASQDLNYNDANMVTNIISKVGTVTESNLNYEYYNDGNTKYKHDTQSNGDNDVTYSYDSMNRLIREDIGVNNGHVNTYEYDYNSNILKKTEGNIVTDCDYVNTKLIHVDVDSKGICKSYDYDINGNLTAGDSKTYTYDVFDQMKTSTSNGVTTSYKYDVYGNRIEKQTGNNIMHHVVSNDNIVADITGYANIKSYIFGNDIEAIKTGTAGDNLAFLLKDAHGDVIIKVDAINNTLNNYNYDVYGKPKTEVTNDNPYLYTSQYYDTETGLYYLRARYYNPEIMQFMSEDTYLGEDNDPLSLNLYTYCEGNPVMYSDPSGHKKTKKPANLEKYYKLPKASKSDALQITIKKNKINIIWKTVFKGKHIKDDNAFNTDKTFSEIIEKAIQKKWSGEYKIKGYDSELKTDVKKVKSSPSTLTFHKKHGLSMTNWYLDGRSGGIINLFNGYKYDNPDTGIKTDYEYGIDEFRVVCAHEFGHVLGLLDGYKNEETANINSIMCDEFGYFNGIEMKNRKATKLDIAKAFDAYKSKTQQGWE